MRRRRGLRLPLINDSHELEESIPLNSSLHHQNGDGLDHDVENRDDEPNYRRQKGKGRVVEPVPSMQEPPIFDVGDSDEDDDDHRLRITGNRE